MIKISNRISRFRNAFSKGAPYFTRKIGSKIIKNESNAFILRILNILRREGYVQSFNIKIVGRYQMVTVYLKYNSQGTSAVRSIFPISTPGRSVYVSTKSLWQPLSTTGIFLISTPFGIFTDIEARRLSIGGLLILGIF